MVRRVFARVRRLIIPSGVAGFRRRYALAFPPIVIVIPIARHSSSARSMLGRCPCRTDRNALTGSRASLAASCSVRFCRLSSASMRPFSRLVVDRFVLRSLVILLSSCWSLPWFRRLLVALAFLKSSWPIRVSCICLCGDLNFGLMNGTHERNRPLLLRRSSSPTGHSLFCERSDVRS